MDEAIVKAIYDLIAKSFGQNGGVYVDATSLAQEVTFPTGSTRGTDSDNPPKKVACCWIPDTDGTFGTCNTNIDKLSGTAFKAGIPKYFKATKINIATGTGTLYFG